MGVNLNNADPEAVAFLGLKNAHGALVINILEKSSAAKAGLKPYDFITQIDGKDIKSAQNLVDAIVDAGVGQTIQLKIIRKGKSQTIKVSLGSHPENRELRKAQTKSYRGQKAPFNLGFSIADYKKAKKDFELPVLSQAHPVVIGVEPGSPAHRAGLSAGDIILDINLKPVYRARDVLKRLKKSTTNILRILRGNNVILLYLGSG